MLSPSVYRGAHCDRPIEHPEAAAEEAYEAKHHPVDPPDPIDAILFRMEQMGLTRADLVPIIGSRARVSEVLNRRRDLSIAMIARIRAKLGISADTLIGRQRAA